MTGAYGEHHQIILIQLPLCRQPIRFPKTPKIDEAPFEIEISTMTTTTTNDG